MVTPQGWTLLERLRADQEKERAAEEAWIDSVLRDRQRALPKERLTAAHIENVKPGRGEP